MRNFLQLLFALLLFSLLSSPSDSLAQWIPQTQKDFKLLKTPSNFIKIAPVRDQNYLYAYNDGNHVFKYDIVNGQLLETKTINNGCYDISMEPDSVFSRYKVADDGLSYYEINASLKIIKDICYYSLSLICRDINNDNIIDSTFIVLSNVNDTSTSYNSFMFINTESLRYVENKQTWFLCLQNFHDSSDFKRYTHPFDKEIFAIKENKVIFKSYGFLSKISNDGNYIAISSKCNYSVVPSDSVFYFSVYNIDSAKLIISNTDTNVLNISPRHYCFYNNSDRLACIQGDSLISVNLRNNSAEIQNKIYYPNNNYNSVKLLLYSQDMAMSLNDEFVIHKKGFEYPWAYDYNNCAMYYDSLYVFDLISKCNIVSYDLSCIDSGLESTNLRFINRGQSILYSMCEKVYCFSPNILKDTLAPIIIANPSKGYPDYPIEFYDRSTGSPDSSRWYFGDGSTSTEKNPIHLYDSLGKYEVMLIVYKNGQADTTSDTIWIANKIKADFTASATNGDVNLNVSFQNNSIGDEVYYQWSFGDGYYSIERNPTHIYAKPGVFNVALRVWDKYFADTMMKTNLISINYPPLSDTVFSRQTLVPLIDTSAIALHGVKSSQGDMFIETEYPILTTISHFDNDLNFDWSKNFKKQTVYKPIKISSSDSVYHTGIDTIEAIDSLGLTINTINNIGTERSEGYAAFNHDSVYFFDYSPLSSGIRYLIKLDTIRASINTLTIDPLAQISSTYSQSLQPVVSGAIDNYNDYCAQAAYVNDNYTQVGTSPVSYWVDQKLYYAYYDTSANSPRIITTNFYASMYNQVKIKKLTSVSKDKSMLLFNNSSIIGLDINDTSIVSLFRDTTLKIEDMTRVNDSTIALCGSKNGICWYGISNIAGNILEEHIANDRHGAFTSIFLNRDGSFLLTGLLNPYISEGLKKTDKTLILKLSNATNSNLGIVAEAAKKFTGVGSDNTTPYFDFSVYPNPSIGSATIDLNNLSSSSAEIKLFDNLGRAIKTIETSESKINIDASGLSSGVYYIQVKSGSTTKTKSFSVSK